MKTKLFLPLTLFSIILSGCNQSNSNIENYMKVISPAGAPAIAFYDQALSNTFETNSTTSNVLAQLSNDDYGMVVFDFYNGLKSIKKNNSPYKLAKIITGGNLYLVGIDTDKEPTKDSKIVSFGENLIPDLAFKHIYGEEIANATKYVNAVSDAGAVLASGMHEGEKVDYVVVAQPVLFSVMNNQNAPTYGKLNVISCFKDEWKEKTGQDAIPQAGVFVNYDYYVNHKNYFEEQFALLDERIETAIDDPLTVKTTMDEQLPNLDDQAAFFGFNSNVAYNVQSNKDTPNGFALVRPDETVDINAFFTVLGVEEDYSDYILTK